MDVFKLAFETTIVGLLAFLWLGVAAYLLFPAVLKDFVVRVVPDFAAKNQTVTGVALLTFTYCLGSAILPISNQLVNDEHWPLPEYAIRCQVFTKQALQLNQVKALELPANNPLDDLEPHHCSYWAPALQKGLPPARRLSRFARLWIGTAISEEEDKSQKSAEDVAGNSAQEAIKNAQPDNQKKDRPPSPRGISECINEGSDACKKQKILTLFQQQESAILNEGTDRTERLRQLHERIVVLRGAVFSGFVLVLICLYAFFARIEGDRKHWVRTVCGGLLSVIFTVFAFLNGFQDLKSQNIFDLPVLEGLLLIITVFGAYLVIKGNTTPLFHKKRLLLIVAFFAALAYGGWMSSEILYDQLVMSSYAALRGEPAPPQH